MQRPQLNIYVYIYLYIRLYKTNILDGIGLMAKQLNNNCSFGKVGGFRTLKRFLFSFLIIFFYPSPTPKRTFFTYLVTW